MNIPNNPETHFSRRKFLKAASHSALAVSFGAGLTSCDNQGNGDTNINITKNGMGSNTTFNFNIYIGGGGSGQNRGSQQNNKQQRVSSKKEGAQRSSGTISMLSTDEMTYSNDGTEDIIIGHLSSDPTTALVLAPGQSVLITNPLGSSGTIENTSTTNIDVAGEIYGPGDTGDWEIT